MNYIVRLPSVKETADAVAANRKPWFANVGSWFVSKKGDMFAKLDMFPDVMFMLSKPKEQSPADQEPGVDQTVPF